MRGERQGDHSDGQREGREGTGSIAWLWGDRGAVCGKRMTISASLGELRPSVRDDGQPTINRHSSSHDRPHTPDRNAVKGADAAKKGVCSAVAPPPRRGCGAPAPGPPASSAPRVWERPQARQRRAPVGPPPPPHAAHTQGAERNSASMRFFLVRSLAFPLWQLRVGAAAPDKQSRPSAGLSPMPEATTTTKRTETTRKEKTSRACRLRALLGCVRLRSCRRSFAPLRQVCSDSTRRGTGMLVRWHSPPSPSSRVFKFHRSMPPPVSRSLSPSLLFGATLFSLRAPEP
jgi:hypothetical protein